METVLNFGGDFLRMLAVAEPSQQPELQWLDFWVFVICAPFAMCFSLFIIYTFFRYDKCRKQPGDIILGISISDFILSTHWFITALFSVHGPFTVDLRESEPFCQINAFFSTTAGINQFLYNVSFCIYMMTKIRHALKNSKIYKNTFHVVNISVTVIMVSSSLFTFTYSTTKPVNLEY